MEMPITRVKITILYRFSDYPTLRSTVVLTRVSVQHISTWYRSVWYGLVTVRCNDFWLHRVQKVQFVNILVCAWNF